MKRRRFCILALGVGLVAASAWWLAHAAEDPAAGLAIPFDMDRDGFATLVVDDADGVRVRNLVAEQPFEAGPRSVVWDCLDDDGIPVAPGTYHWRGITRGGIDLRYEFSVNTPNSPSWHTPDTRGAWLADHSPPMAAFAFEDVVFLGSPGPEANHGLIAVDLSGKKLWGWRHGMGDGPTQLAGDERYLYCLSDQGTAYLYRFERVDGGRTMGSLVPFPGKNPLHKLSQYDIGPWTPHTHGFACRGGRLYAAHTHTNLLLEIDAATAEVLRTIPLPEPRGLATGPDGNLWAVSGRRIGIVGLDDDSFTPVVTVPNPVRSIAFGPDGRLFAGDMETCQVRVFERDGKAWRETRVIGKGPRGMGRYDPDEMSSTYGLTVDGSGTLWVAEAGFHPKRVSLWNTADGRLRRELVGPPLYGGGGSFDPRDASRFVYNGVEFSVDWETGGWRPLNILQRVPHPVVEAGVRHDGRGILSKIVYHGNNRYLLNESAWLSFTLLSKIADGVAVPLCMAWPTQPPSALNVWTDRNGDGLMQPDETGTLPPETFSRMFLPDNRKQGAWTLGVGFAHDLALHIAYIGHVWRIPVTGWTPHGSPEYDLAAIRKIGETDAMQAPQTVDSQGTTLFGSPLTAMTLEGKVKWQYPSEWVGVHGSHRAPVGGPGRILGVLDMTGVADVGGALGEVFVLHNNFGQQYMLTTDGLFVATLFRDHRAGPKDLPPTGERGALLNETCVGPESFFQSFGVLPSGVPVVVCGRSDSKVVSLRGLETARRVGGRLSVSLADNKRLAAHRARAAAAAARDFRAAGERRYYLRRAKAPPLLDYQDQGGWPAESRLHIPMPNGEGHASLAVDDENLHVRIDTQHRIPGIFGNPTGPVTPEGHAGVEVRLAVPTAAGVVPTGLFFALTGDWSSTGMISRVVKGRRVSATLEGAAVLMRENQAWPHDPVRMNLRARVPLRLLAPHVLPGQEIRGDVVLAWRQSPRVLGRNAWCDAAPSADLDPERWGSFVWSGHGAARRYTVRRAAAKVVDGKLRDWANVDAMRFPPGENTVEARMTHDGDTLYLAVEAGRSPMLANAGGDFTTLFKSGGAVDLMIAAQAEDGDPVNPQRLLMTVVGKEPLAVLHRPLPGLPQPVGSERRSEVRYHSPAGETTFHSVDKLSRVSLAVKPAGDGYVLEAAIPAEQLGLRIEPGAAIVGDVGVIVSNEAGAEVNRRLYWSNADTVIVADIPSEARLVPENWGVWVFE